LNINKILLFSLIVNLASCSTITIISKTSDKLVSNPTFEERKEFYWWGFSGGHRVDVKKICKKSEIQQMQTQQTFKDSLLTIITLGFYSARMIKVWCK